MSLILPFRCRNYGLLINSSKPHFYSFVQCPPVYTPKSGLHSLSCKYDTYHVICVTEHIFIYVRYTNQGQSYLSFRIPGISFNGDFHLTDISKLLSMAVKNFLVKLRHTDQWNVLLKCWECVFRKASFWREMWLQKCWDYQAFLEGTQVGNWRANGTILLPS